MIYQNESTLLNNISEHPNKWNDYSGAEKNAHPGITIHAQ